jgi:hypothetical protein
MSHAQLGNLAFRLDPTQIHYAWTVDYTVIDTLGGQVIQVLGTTLGDLTISGLFGQNGTQQSWQLAESFNQSIRDMMDAQSLPAQTKTISPVVHQPIRFTFQDGVHNWDFKVMIKGIQDTTGTGSVSHATGKSSYGYTLTLFIVQDSSLNLAHIAQDQFVTRFAAGLGWKKTGVAGVGDYSGVASFDQALKFIQDNGGSVDNYLASFVGKTS